MSNEVSRKDGSEETEGRPGWLWMVLGLVAVAIGVGVMMIAGRGAAPQDGESAQQDSISYVETVRPEPAGATFEVRAPGRLEPRERLDLVGEISGKVTGIHPDLQAGGRVQRGETLLQIDDGDVRADVERAEAQLATAQARLSQAEAERDRQMRLAELGAAPEKAAEQAIAAYEDAEAGLRSARSQLTIARRSLRKASVSAPFDAIVTSESVAPGTFVSPGQSLATLISADAGEIQAGLPPGDVQAVRNAMKARAGGRMRVRAVPNGSSLGQAELEGYISEFLPVVDQQSRTATFIAIFPDAFVQQNEGDVFAGDYMDVLVEGRLDEPLWLIPDGAVRQDEYVWVVNADEQLERLEVDPVDRDPSGVLLRAPGLSENTDILMTVLAEEIEGMRVHKAEPSP